MAKYQRREYKVQLDWIGPVEYLDIVNDKLKQDTLDFLNEYVGIYFWRAKTGVFTRANLYVGQTWQGLLRRTKQHVKGKLGQRLDTFYREGKTAYVWAASVAPLPLNCKLEKGVPDLLFNSLERGLIMTLKPIWNLAETRETIVPLTVEIYSQGSIPPGVNMVMKIEQGEYYISD